MFPIPGKITRIFFDHRRALIDSGLRSNHAEGSETISGSALPALPYIQLLPARAAPGYGAFQRYFRADSGAGAEVVRILRCGIRGHAGARSPAYYRTGASEAVGRSADAEAECCADAARG